MKKVCSKCNVTKTLGNFWYNQKRKCFSSTCKPCHVIVTQENREKNKVMFDKVINLKNEIWKDIPTYEGVYQISNFGRIKSLNRVYKGEKRQGKLLKQNISKTGYYCVSLSQGRKNVKRKKVHRLLSEAFIPNPKDKCCINHKNGIKTDNRIKNLEWVTYSENNTHAYKIGLKKQIKKL